MGKRYPELPVVAVGVVLVDESGRLLVVRRARPPAVNRWTVPGGTIELGESLEAAVLRELAEETGLSCELGPVVEVLDRVVRDDAGRIEYHYVILDFLGTRPSGLLRPASDAREARWVTRQELAALDTTDGLGPVVDHALAMHARGDSGPYRAREA